MAKIYETQKDFERDKLTDQIGRLEKQKHAQEGLGWTLFGSSLLVDLFNAGRNNFGNGLSYLSGFLMVGSVVEWVQSWRTGNQAHALELQRERMGPERIILPAEAVVATTAEKDCGCNVKQQPRSLLEYALKSNDSLSKT